MAQLRQTVLLVACAFLVLQEMPELVAAATGLASFSTDGGPPTACFGLDPTRFPPDNFFAAGSDSPSANTWANGTNCGKNFTIQCIGNGCNGHGPISVEIVDHCPNGCEGRAFDLSETAFATIADPVFGLITVEYSGPSSLNDEDGETFTAEVGHVGQ